MRQLLLCSLLILSAGLFAAKRAAVPRLPDPVRPLAEVETNVAFSVGTPIEDKWTLAVELDPSVSNCVEVVFGVDENSDGEMGLEEGQLCVGWDCGEWFWRNRLDGSARRIEADASIRKLELVMYLDSMKAGRAVVGNVFSREVAPAYFNSAWNLMRVVSRGAERLEVTSRISVNALVIKIR